MKMTLRVIKYSVLLFLALVLVGYTQECIYQVKGGNWLNGSLANDYIYNFIISFVLGIVFILVFQRQPEKLGFAFLGSISLKFILFFIFIYPNIRADNTITSLEFANFFSPFLTCLIIEVSFLLSLLRSQS